MTPHPSIDGTRLTTEAYLEHLDADVAALLDASADLTAPVPGCPDWTVRDLLSHVVGVYRHKIVALDTDAQPEQQGFDSWGVIAEGADPRDVLREEYSALRQRLAARDASAATYAWWPSEQTVGFWQRRMAHETAVHRWDAQSAVDGPDSADPIEDHLAVDGVDELLGWLTWPWDEVPQPAATGQSVLVSTADHSWTVTLHPTRVEVVGGGSESAVALVAGEPSGLLLHLWGRPGEHGIATGGDNAALELLRERLVMLAT
jgi:uncharacterized protein (TIGR03083 family)